jgi:hypothetical protein
VDQQGGGMERTYTNTKNDDEGSNSSSPIGLKTVQTFLSGYGVLASGVAGGLAVLWRWLWPQHFPYTLAWYKHWRKDHPDPAKRLTVIERVKKAFQTSVERAGAARSYVKQEFEDNFQTEHLSLLKKMVADENGEVRQAAYDALLELKINEAGRTEALQDALKHFDEEGRLWVIEQLEKINSHEDIDLLDRIKTIVLDQFGDESKEVLIEARRIAAQLDVSNEELLAAYKRTLTSSHGYLRNSLVKRIPKSRKIAIRITKGEEVVLSPSAIVERMDYENKKYEEISIEELPEDYRLTKREDTDYGYKEITYTIREVDAGYEEDTGRLEKFMGSLTVENVNQKVDALIRVPP